MGKAKIYIWRPCTYLNTWTGKTEKSIGHVALETFIGHSLGTKDNLRKDKRRGIYASFYPKETVGKYTFYKRFEGTHYTHEDDLNAHRGHEADHIIELENLNITAINQAYYDFRKIQFSWTLLPLSDQLQNCSGLVWYLLNLKKDPSFLTSLFRGFGQSFGGVLGEVLSTELFKKIFLDTDEPFKITIPKMSLSKEMEEILDIKTKEKVLTGVEFELPVPQKSFSEKIISSIAYSTLIDLSILVLLKLALKKNLIGFHFYRDLLIRAISSTMDEKIIKDIFIQKNRPCTLAKNNMKTSYIVRSIVLEGFTSNSIQAALGCQSLLSIMN